MLKVRELRLLLAGILQQVRESTTSCSPYMNPSRDMGWIVSKQARELSRGAFLFRRRVTSYLQVPANHVFCERSSRVSVMQDSISTQATSEEVIKRSE